MTTTTVTMRNISSHSSTPFLIPSTTTSSLHSRNTNIKYHHNHQYSSHYHLTIFNPNSKSKVPFHSSSIKLSSMATQTSNSGLPITRCSWVPNVSMGYDVASTSGCRLSPLHSVARSSPAVISSVQDLFEFICSGPLLKKIGLTREMVETDIDRWLECGSQICRLFGLNEVNLSLPQKVRVFHYYIPVFLWCEDQIEKHRATFKEGEDIPPLVIGFSAPQGCGKTTLVFALDFLFRASGRNPATISIDDFYLTAKDQGKLRDQYSGNSLLELRGNAGSHDLPFCVETLTALTQMTKEGMKMKLPRYDKSAYGGKGDRADSSQWPEAVGPLTVVLFEGWMLGFRPVPIEVVKEVDPQLEIVNKHLEAYYNAWDRFIKSWIIIKIKDPSCVYQWRLQAEVAMRAEGKPGMSDEEVMDFVSRYLPAYKAYLPSLYTEGPKGSDPEHLLVVEIDEERNPILAG